MSNLTFPLQTDFDFCDDQTGTNEGAMMIGFKFCVDYKVVKVIEEGPGSGWPNFIVEFQNEDELRKFVMRYSENNQEVFDEYWELLLDSHK